MWVETGVPGVKPPGRSAEEEFVYSVLKCREQGLLRDLLGWNLPILLGLQHVL